MQELILQLVVSIERQSLCLNVITGKRGTMFKKKMVYVCAMLASVCLSACSGGSDEIILIGNEDGAVAQEMVGLPEKDRREPALETENETEDIYAEEVQEPMMVRVHVCGAVVCPGVVELAAGSRVEDALEVCGGFAEGADLSYVNLAAWVVDGEMIYFPTAEEVAAGQVRQRVSATYGGYMPVTSKEVLVNINTADVSLLCTLPGVGESRAKEIIAYREKNGPFGSCEALMDVPGIKAGIYEKMSSRITVE